MNDTNHHDYKFSVAFKLRLAWFKNAYEQGSNIIDKLGILVKGSLYFLSKQKRTEGCFR